MPTSPPPRSRFVARAQVALGTLVEVALPAEEARPERFAAAFAAIDHVHARMSAHDTESDIARIARHAHRRPVAVDRHTYAVLVLALELRAASRGVFDVTIAPALARTGRLPGHARGLVRDRTPAGELMLEASCRVRATAPVALDLGGIAKGYAVDCAVAALLATGATTGIVNAGGDLRAFGHAHWHAVHVRHPGEPAQALHLCDVRDHAVATSAGYFAGVLVDPRTRRVRHQRHSVSVVARSCVMADALTKVVALDPEGAPALLVRYEAQAWRLATRGAALALRTAGAVVPGALRMPQVAAA